MDKPMGEVFSHNLKNCLYMAGMTQSELAKAVNATETSVSKWINGAAVPRPKMVDKICKALKCNRADLMIDHEKKAFLAPTDLLVAEIQARPELYDLLCTVVKMNKQDIELMLSIANRLQK